MACYIYRHPDHKEWPIVYKIGKANDVKIRHEKLQTAYDNEIVDIWYLYPVLDKDYSSGMLYFIEKKCHSYLEKWRRSKREFFTIININKCLTDLIYHLNNEVGIRVNITQNIIDLKNLHDYSVKDDIEDYPIYPINCQLNPYDYQLEILDSIKKWYISNNISGKLILPPGIGKSYITSFWLRNLPIETKVLVLVPYLSIQDDFKLVIEKCQVRCQVDIVVNNTAWQGIRTFYDIIIYDEAHHLCSMKNHELLNLESKKKLFLTATEKTLENEDIPDMSDPIFGKYIYKMDIIDAIRIGCLVDYKIFLADWTLGLENMIRQLKDIYLRKKIIMFFNNVSLQPIIYTKLLKNLSSL